MPELLVIERALIVSTQAHEGQLRKGTSKPYIGHPIRVAQRLAEFGEDQVTIAAGLLHDVLEDSPAGPHPYTEADMRSEFDDEITDIVRAVTIDPRIPSWRDRVRDYFNRVRASRDDRTCKVFGTDKLDSIDETLRDLKEEGPAATWGKFKAGPADQAQLCTEVHLLVAERLPGHPLTSQLGKLVGQLAIEAEKV